MILVCGDENQIDEIKSGMDKLTSDIVFVSSVMSTNLKDYRAFLFLNEVGREAVNEAVQYGMVFINEVIKTLDELNMASKVIRINGWPGFLKRRIWEGAGNITSGAEDVVQRLGRQLLKVADIPGFVSARVIVSVINEAFKAKEENVASEGGIDEAMRLGTNYPLGPFEWCREIGRDKVHALLSAMALTEPGYTPFFTLNESE